MTTGTTGVGGANMDQAQLPNVGLPILGIVPSVTGGVQQAGSNVYGAVNSAIASIFGGLLNPAVLTGAFVRIGLFAFAAVLMVMGLVIVTKA
jgi:hypothetical protein